MAPDDKHDLISGTCSHLPKQLAMIFMSVLAGNMYESIGFQGAYLVLGLVALGFTLISVFTLSGPGPLSLLRRQVNEVA